MAAAGLNAFCGALEHCGLTEPARLAVSNPDIGGITSMNDMACLGKDGMRRLAKVLRDQDTQ